MKFRVRGFGDGLSYCPYLGYPGLLRVEIGVPLVV